jgi:hypothetical protein
MFVFLINIYVQHCNFHGNRCEEEIATEVKIGNFPYNLLAHGIHFDSQPFFM